MNAVRPAQLSSRRIDVQPSLGIGKFGMNDLARDLCRPGIFKLIGIGKLKKQHPRAPLLDRWDQLLDSLYIHPRGERRIFRIKLLQCAIRIDAVVEIAGRLREQSAEGEGDLRVTEGRMNPALVGRYSGPDRTKKHRLGVDAP